MSYYKLVDEKTEQQLILNTWVKDFRGDKMFLIGYQAPRNENSTGRITVRFNGFTQQFYPSVIGAKIVEVL